jgi:CRISP-associated protein Cas1
VSLHSPLLKKCGLRQHDFSVVEKVNNLEADDLSKLRTRLTAYEGHCSDKYFSQVFGLMPESLRPEFRKTFKAYDGMNNIFNLAYEVLSWKVHHALIKAKLEPYLGFLHSLQHGKPSFGV